jgi:D-alanyl-D-alanine carboxypeptidase
MASWTRVMALTILAAVAIGSAVVAQGPPPQIRELIDGIVVAANGDADAWERFAQSNFSPEYLKTQTREERAAIHHQIVDRFGTVTRGGVTREGPGAPLQISVAGSKSSGVIFVSVDDKTFRITNVSLAAPPGATREASNALPPIPIDRSLTSEQIDQRLHEYFSKLAQDEVFSGVALVARNGAPVFARAYGFADRDRKIPNTIQTRFNIGSINKVFTQIAINQLIAEGKLSRTDTLGKFYPDYPQVISRTATVEQLLNHQAGLADFFGPQFNSANKMDFASNVDYFKFVGNLPPTFAPGERTQYCNGCYIALGAIVAKVAMPYEKYVAEKIFAPAEMGSTGYLRSDQPAPDIALGYTRRGGDSTLRSNITMHGVAGSAAGGGYSTALDLLTFVKAIKAGKFPGTDPNLAIAGGAPGTNALVAARGEWMMIVLTNFDPPTGEQVAEAIVRALTR